MDRQDHIVFVVDDDRRICEALTELLSSFDMHVVTFGSAAEYIAYPKPDVPTCLILDVELPDINGLELQSQVHRGITRKSCSLQDMVTFPLFCARDQGRRGRLPDQTIQGGGPDARDQCCPRARSQRQA